MSMIRDNKGRQVRQNPEVTKNIEESVTALKLAVRRAEILSTLKGHQGWETAQEILGDKVKFIETKLGKPESLEQREIDFILKEKAVLKSLINIVDDFEKGVPGFLEMIAEGEKKLESRKNPTV